MRINGGKYKGRKLKALPDNSIRPTSDKVKQAIFNILMHEITDAVVLDLFSGSGALGIEALSRNAKSVVFVEAGTKQARLIGQNLKLLEIESVILQKKYETACELLSFEKKQFDLIFADPPYNEIDPNEVVMTVAQYDLLTESGLLIIEHKTGHKFKEKWLRLIKNRKFGQTEISFFARLEKT